MARQYPVIAVYGDHTRHQWLISELQNYDVLVFSWTSPLAPSTGRHIAYPDPDIVGIFVGVCLATLPGPVAKKNALEQIPASFFFFEGNDLKGLAPTEESLESLFNHESMRGLIRDTWAGYRPSIILIDGLWTFLSYVERYVGNDPHLSIWLNNVITYLRMVAPVVCSAPIQQLLEGGSLGHTKAALPIVIDELVQYAVCVLNGHAKEDGVALTDSFLDRVLSYPVIELSESFL